MEYFAATKYKKNKTVIDYISICDFISHIAINNAYILQLIVSCNSNFIFYNDFISCYCNFLSPCDFISQNVTFEIVTIALFGW